MQVMRNGVRIDYRPIQKRLTPTTRYAVFDDDGVVIKGSDGDRVFTYTVSNYQQAVEFAQEIGGMEAALVWPLTPAR